MQFIKDFFDLLYNEMIEINHLDAIHDIAKKDKVSLECRAFEEWYKANILGDQDDD